MTDTKSLTRRMYDEVFNQGDVDAVDRYLAADCVDHEVAPDATGDARADLKTFATSAREAFEGFRIDVEDLIAEGDKVVARVTMRGRHTSEFMGIPRTGHEIAVSIIDIMTVRDGLVAEHWGVLDSATLMAQLGASG